MAYTLNRRLSTLVDSNGQLNTGKIANDYITSDHVADNSITTAMLHTGFTLPTSSLSSIDTDNITEGSTNLFYTDARVDSRLSGGTGVTYSSGTISIGQAVATSDSPTFADLTVTGNLNITGDINSYNVTDLDVTDQTITLGAGQIESNSGGSGIIIDGSNASILWDETNDQFDFNKGVNIDSNTLVVDGTNNRVGILNAAPDVSLDVGSSTDAIHMPVGTTAQRPSSPAAGYFRYNSDDGQFEGYTTEWGAIAGGGASAMETNNFTGDGSTTAFTLSSTVASEDNLIVFIEGIYQNKGDYVASGTTLTFTTAPVNGRRIVVQHIKSSVAGNSTLYTSLSGDGSTTAFTLSGAPGHENNTQVFMDGVYQQKDSYIVNGTTLTFDAAPANGSSIEVMSFAQTTINQPGSNTVSVAELNLSDGTSGQFITTDGNGTLSFATVSGTTINNNADNRIITGSGTANTLEGESSLTYDGNTLTADYDLAGFGTNIVSKNTNNSSIYSRGSGISFQVSNGSATKNAAIIKGGRESTTSGGYLYFETADSSWNTPAERMRIDSAGNVGINESSPDFSGFGSNGGGLELDDVGANFTAVKVSHGATGNLYLAANTGAGYLWQYSNSPLIIGTNNAERIRIQDGTGRMGINTVGIAYSSSEKLSLYNDNFGFGIKAHYTCAGMWNGETSGTYIAFAYGSGGTGGGGITFSGSTTSYTSASDYRLKENVSYDWDATTRLKQLKPARFNWISDSTNTLQDGFLAHEVSSIVPEAVTGEKDAVYTVEEAENDAGAEAGDIKAQTIDHAKLVPLLVKTIQELEARITTLEG